MARTTISRRGFIWIPQEFRANFALTVEREGGTIDTITDRIHNLEIEEGVTETIGNFKFDIWDPNETFKEAWNNGYEIVRFYSDYAATADTLRFTGRIELPSMKGNKINVTGRTEGLFFFEVTVTQSFVDQNCDEILKSLNIIYSPGGFTTNNVEPSSKKLTVNWSQKPFWECVQELCIAAGFDAYVDKDRDWNFFEIGSRTNDDEAIVHDQNLLEIGDFAEDITLIRNRIIVYGALVDGIRTFYMAEDLASQEKYNIIKEEVIRDDNILDNAQAKVIAEFHLSITKDPPVIGEVTGLLMATIQPGERIRLSSPENNISPGVYDIISYKHDVLNHKTIVRVNKDPRRVSHIIRNMITSQQKTQDTSANPKEMRFSFDLFFNDDNGTHSGTQITDGILKMEGVVESATWISDARTHPSDITQAYLVVIGETLTGATYEVSADDGNKYQPITNKGLINFSNVGKKLRIRVKTNDPDTQIDTIQVQFK